ncbi:uncharacterized protein KQ657_002282 [Scheffersomyces spartinae]|uniref:PABS domain-containing protein n=1 Tax=Scheffersomyces spartinae TaxID=45513 RepID=A0A9P7VDX9_9ASCO|nr:uncharacterized protein KQ657_002282 [Scheffersomyces spartinae]KAG7195897.1 hypothetical protein KQ657_002282 [Scheffersomyces spartinae]
MSSSTHPSIQTLELGEQWFFEKDPATFPGQIFGLQVARVLHHTKSPFQDILVFESTDYGNVLVLNGIIQCTERDEFAYQELISHTPLMAHSNPKNVLIIGGGDCGVAREVGKHIETLESVTMVEIDALVIELAKKYFPNMTTFVEHPKFDLIIDDGFKFLKETTKKYDVIITDSSDPEGPAVEFFREGYFNLLSNALADDGIVIMQSSENIWLNLPYIKSLNVTAKKVFPNVLFSQCYMPSYTGGQLGLLIASKNAKLDLKRPQRIFDSETEMKLFKYYSSEIHEASFVLPTWAKNVLS